MSLHNFKGRLRFSSIAVFLLFYAVVFYLLGSQKSLQGILNSNGENKNGDGKALELPINSPIPYADTQTGKVISSFVKLCSNIVHSYEVSYPKDWFTTYSEGSGECSFFAPYTFVVPVDTGTFFVPVKLEIHSILDWPNLQKLYLNPNDFQNIVSVENKEIEGKSATKVRSSATGNGSAKQGFLNIAYLIFDVERPVVISYQQLDETEDIGKMEEGLNEIASSFKYF